MVGGRSKVRSAAGKGFGWWWQWAPAALGEFLINSFVPKKLAKKYFRLKIQFPGGREGGGLGRRGTKDIDLGVVDEDVAGDEGGGG